MVIASGWIISGKVTFCKNEKMGS